VTAQEPVRAELDEVVPDALAGERLDRLVAMAAGLSRVEAATAIAAGDVRVDDQVVTVRSRRLVAGQRVQADLAELAAARTTGVRADGTVEFRIVHVDDDLIVVDKPAGLVVHPGAGHSTGTLVQGLLDRFPELADVGDPERPGIVHRLDKGTSGLLVVARTPRAYTELVRQMAAHEVERRYLALVWGELDTLSGMVDAPVGRSAREPTRMAVSSRGREARTRYDVITTYRQPAVLSLIECQLETGRTHQIRVHLSAIGHPVVGDGRYGGARAALPVARPWLHAASLRLVHPTTGVPVAFDAPLPSDLEAVLGALEP
jgi:23S rRNA pseudouridine1911/1915/1917 synthase